LLRGFEHVEGSGLFSSVTGFGDDGHQRGVAGVTVHADIVVVVVVVILESDTVS
jgi:hypothetical protein